MAMAEDGGNGGRQWQWRRQAMVRMDDGEGSKKANGHTEKRRSEDGYGTVGSRVITLPKGTQKKRGKWAAAALLLKGARRGGFLRSIQNEYSTRKSKYEKER